jgi:hypothetical protein
LQAFARLSAVYGGTYMLAKPDVEVVYGEDGAAVGVTSEGETAKAKFIVGDPTYFREKVRGVWLAGLGVLELWAGWVWQEPQAGGWAFWVKLQIWQVTCWLEGGAGRPVRRRISCPPFSCLLRRSLQVRKTGQVVRAMCIMSHPIPSTNDSHSVQIILPQKQLNRRHGEPAAVLALAGNCGVPGLAGHFVCASMLAPNSNVLLSPALTTSQSQPTLLSERRH